MNKNDQKIIVKLVARLQEMQADIENLHSVYEEAFSARSEKYLESEKAEKDQEEIDALQDAMSSVEQALDALMNIDVSAVQ